MLEEANTRLRNKLEIDEWLARVMEEAEQEAAALLAECSSRQRK